MADGYFEVQHLGDALLMSDGANEYISLPLELKLDPNDSTRRTFLWDGSGRPAGTEYYVMVDGKIYQKTEETELGIPPGRAIL